MFQFIEAVNPDVLMVGGAVGVLLAFIFALLFLWERIKKVIGKSEKEIPGLTGSLRNLLLILLLIAVSGVFLFFGFFLRAYSAFTYEEPIAKIYIEPLGEKTSKVELHLLQSEDTVKAEEFIINGDQWMIEGDILKWDEYLNFAGLHTRYRLTRLRGRYIKTYEELNNTHTIYSLVENEDEPFWNFMYDIGHKLPLVSTVYGNASFQMADKRRAYEIFVSTSGFVVREIK